MTDLDQAFAVIDEELARLGPFLTETRRHLHAHPELSGQEKETTRFVADALTQAGIAFRMGPGGRGLFTEMPARSEADPGPPLLALRADLDALPIGEENQVPYRSRHSGVMHACGHDAHTAILLTATLALHRVGGPPRWRALFQPSEEVGQGALEMIRAGALQSAGAVVALHVDPNRLTGEIGATPGPRTAWCQDFVLAVRGRGGHAARPHAAIDPIAAAAQLVTLIYQTVPRNQDARDPVVVTIGSIHGGHASNVIPDEVALKGTIRSVDEKTAVRARDSLAQVCAGAAQVSGASVEARFEPPLPGLANDEALTRSCAEVARGLVGDAAVVTSDRMSMGAEDFAEYARRIPGCMLNLGTRAPGTEVTPLHTPCFDIDERALAIGARLLARVVLRWSNPAQKDLC